MAKAAALLIAALALPAVAAARGAESDPERRSLVVEAVERASPAVVNVSTEQIVERRGSPFPFPQDPFFDEFFRDFVDPRAFDAKLVGADADADIAIVRVQAGGALPAVTLGSSSDLMIGESVIAIG